MSTFQPIGATEDDDDDEEEESDGDDEEQRDAFQKRQRVCLTLELCHAPRSGSMPSTGRAVAQSPRYTAMSHARASLEALFTEHWPGRRWTARIQDLNTLIEHHHAQLQSSLMATGFPTHIGFYHREVRQTRTAEHRRTYIKLCWYARVHRWFGTETCRLWYARHCFIRQWTRRQDPSMTPEALRRDACDDTGNLVMFPCFYTHDDAWSAILREHGEAFLSVWEAANGPLARRDATRLFRSLYNLEAGIFAHMPYHILFQLACTCAAFKQVLHQYHEELTLHRRDVPVASPRELDPSPLL